MFEKIQNIAIPGVIILGILSVSWWLTANPVKDLTISEPGMDNRGEGNAFVQDVAIGEIFNELGSPRNQLKRPYAITWSYETARETYWSINPLFIHSTLNS